MSTYNNVERSTSGSDLLSPASPEMQKHMHHPTPVRMSSWDMPSPTLDMDELDRELECISQISVEDDEDLRSSLSAELDSEIDDVLRSAEARAAWESVQAEVCTLPLPSRSPWASCSSSPSRSRSPPRTRQTTYPEPIGTPRKPASTSSLSAPSSPEPETPSAPSAFYSPPSPSTSAASANPSSTTGRSAMDHPSLQFWHHLSPTTLSTLQSFVALWISNGLTQVERNWRSLDVTEEEKEATRRAYEGLLEQYEALRAYRVYRRGCTAMQLLDELSC